MLKLTDIQAILTLQAEEKRKVQWELYDLKTIQSVCVNTPGIDSDEMLVIGDRYPGVKTILDGDPIEFIRENFSEVDKFLKLGDGHMVLAGGAVASNLLQQISGGASGADADFFFYDMTIDEGKSLLDKIIKKAFDDYPGLVYVTRSQHVTTLFICGEYYREDLEEMQDDPKNRLAMLRHEAKEYQFIHRIYPNKSSIIGSFDISLSSFMYDGADIYTTAFGLFALRNGVIIADLGSRSTSFDNRLRKYARRFYGMRIVFVSTKPTPALQTGKRGWIQVGGSIRVMKNPSLRLLQTVLPGDQSVTRDYEGGDGCLEDMEITNTLLCARGNPNHVQWGGESYKEVMKADIQCFSRKQVEDHFDDIMTHESSYLTRWFGWQVAKTMRPGQPLDSDHMDELWETIEKTYEEAFRLSSTGVTWYGMNDNPGRQRFNKPPLTDEKSSLPNRVRFTASFNPIHEISSWYNPKIYIKRYIGVHPDVWTTVRCAQLRRDGPLGGLSRDTVRFIFQKLWEMIGEEARKKLFT